jgi:hypothetical protein
MALNHSPQTVTDGLMFYYDMGNPQKSWKGAPTTNLNRNSKDVSGSDYSPDAEWTSSEPTRFIKTYNPSIVTPLGTGATLLQESGINGYHHLSRWGGGEATGDHALSCYVYPIATNIDNFSIGLLAAGRITFNLTNRTISYSSGEVVSGSGFIQDVPGYPGWLRIGGVINGRAGGWVGCIGLSVGNVYTGTSGGRAFYIAGLQYERRALPTAFIEAQQTRSNTQAILDLTNNNTVTANSLTYNADGSFGFNGTNNEMHPPINHSYLSSSALEVIFRSTSHGAGYKTIFGYRHNSGFSLPTIGSLYLNSNNLSASVIAASQVYRTATSSVSIATNTFYHVVLNKNTSTGLLEIYVNGLLTGSQTFDAATYGQWTAVGQFIGADILDIGKSTNTNSGQGWATDFFNGIIPVAKVYNRVLTAAEVQQNFNALRGRYGL